MLLQANGGSYMAEAPGGLAAASQTTCQSLLETAQQVPADTLFRDVFKVMCQKMLDKNETRVLRDITPLIVPSAETLYIFGNDNLKLLVESTTERWGNSIPVTKILPQPDYSVGFQHEAFTDDQRAKLSPYIGDFILGDQSFFMATYYMCFPFLTCEVKCGGGGLDIADRQNAHSMTLAVRAVVELFRLVHREEEIDHQILAFSLSHDHQSVRIYSHYPVVDRKETKYYRRPIRNFTFTELDGRDKWTAYRFVKNVYDMWMPEHLERIRSAIDQLPAKLGLDVAPLSDGTLGS